MNILMVCREMPYPLNAGYKIRTFNLLRRLSKNNSISLLCYDFGDNSLDNRAGIQHYCDTIKLVIPPRMNSKIRQIPNIVKNLMAGEPLVVKYVKSASMKTAIIEMINTRHIDLIHFDDPYITANFDFDDDKNTIKKTVTYHDIDSMKFLRTYKIETNIRKKMMLLLDLFLLKKWEEALVKKTDLSIVMSRVDARRLRSQAGAANIAIIPNGVDTEKFSFNGGDMSNTVSFFGTMDYLPNQDAVFYFYQKILPMIRRKNPEVKFIVIGRNPGKKLKNLANDPNVIVTGNVDNVIPYYYKSSVVVVPLRAGGGTRLKILEAMAVGCPVVSSVIGAEGLDVAHGENILVADNPELFADLTVELMTNKALREKLTVTARTFVERRYSWDRIADVMTNVYLKLFRNELTFDHALAGSDKYAPDVF